MSSEFEDALLEYLKNNEEPVGSNGSLPFRVLSHVIKEDDLEGECYNIVLSHLRTSSFPDILAFAIAQNVVKTILSQDLSDVTKDNDEEIKTYETIKISRILFVLVHSLCNDWIGNLPSDVQSQPQPPKHSHCGIKNTRRKMEDRHSVIPNLNILLDLKDAPIVQWYAIYDGHGGLDASNYASKQLHLNFGKQDGLLVDVPESLKASILKTDQEFCVKAKHDHYRSGTTAAVAVIIEDHLHVAWLGDSQVLLVKDGKPITVMDPHKPDREDEKQRIEDMGGCVVWFGAWRVNGTLSVSRAIGDVDHKPFISGEADTYSMPLDGSEDFLCLACDGFWDVFNGNDLTRLVKEYIRKGSDRAEVAEYLCMKAKAEGSTDNITVIIVFLREHINLAEETTEENTATTNMQDENDYFETEKTSDNGEPVGDNGDDDSVSDDGLAFIQGQQLDLEQKQKIPHKLLLNYIRNSQQKKICKSTVLVTRTYPHAKLPHTLRNPKLENPVIPPLHRADIKSSALSLATVESIRELPVSKPKRFLDQNNNTSELPAINNNILKNTTRRASLAISSSPTDVIRKPLGHRAPNHLTRGYTRLPYRTSIVAPCRRGHSRSPSPCRGYVSSLPEELIRSHEKGKSRIAITNSLAPSLKPRQRNKQTVIHQRVRRRSRSLF